MTNKKEKSIENIIIVLGILTIILSSFVNPYGVTAPYWEENPLVMAPGETKNISIILQNMVGNEDIKLKVELKEGSKIASSINNVDYLVPFGRKDINADFKIKIPENAKSGDNYRITVQFRQIDEDEGKMLQLATSIQTSFPVIIEENIKKSPTEQIAIKWIIPTILIFIMSAIIFIIFIMISLIKKIKNDFIAI